MKYDVTIRVDTDDIDATQALLYAHVGSVYPFTIEAIVRIHEQTPSGVVETDPRLYGRIHNVYLPNGQPVPGVGINGHRIVDGIGWQGE